MKTSQMKPSRLVMALLAAGAIGGAGATAVIGGVSMAAGAPAVSAPLQAINPSTPPNFAQITRDYGPAVVNISVSGTRKVSLGDGDPFAQFFGQFPARAARCRRARCPCAARVPVSSSAPTASS